MNRQIAPIVERINRVIVAKEQQVQLAIACFLTGGHVLIDDIPGVGKTTFCHALARSFGLQYKRVQFTSDLLPSDIIGISVFDPAQQAFSFHPGAIFTQVILADEINRASAKTQSALLEAMEEGQVTVDGECHVLPEPFFLIATQNPLEQQGTNPLPESQLDRFSIRLVLGYPPVEVERRLWKGENGRVCLEQISPALSIDDIRQLRQQVESIFVSDSLLDYLEDIVQYTRHSGRYRHGLSPRAGLVLLQMTRAWALLQGRDYAIPDDLQTVLPYVAAHRLQSKAIEQSIEEIQNDLKTIAIP